jgi:hypothetical protein
MFPVQMFSKHASVCGLAEVLSQEIAKRFGPPNADPPSATFSEANLTNYFSTQIFGFAIA